MKLTIKKPVIIVAGASGDLGARIASYLVTMGAQVVALVRKGRKGEAPSSLKRSGITTVEVDYHRLEDLVAACQGGNCVVSALSGLEEVIVDAQSMLLRAAVQAGVPRFIPSDYCIDYTRIEGGNNRNLDLRRRFQQVLDKAPIRATSVLNGMFMHLLTGQAPVILFKFKRVFYWENADQLLDFTTIDNTAQYTAHAALDESAPRWLRIAGEVTTARGLAQTASTVIGKPFGLLKGGKLSRLQSLIKLTRVLAPMNKQVFPPWQGMAYLQDMFEGKVKLHPQDNGRYPGMHWTSVQEVLQKRKN